MIPKVQYSLTQFLLIKKDFVDQTPALNDGMYGVPYGVVYMITDLRNGKVYVGKTENFDRRVSEYIRFTRIDRNLSPMHTLLREEGIEHFRIKKVWECWDRCDLDETEQRFIMEKRAYDSKYGYNIRFWKNPIRYSPKNRNSVRRKLSQIHTGVNMGASCKRKHGRPCIAIHTERKVVYFAHTMRLLADAVFHCDRSMVARATRRLQRIRGFFVFYRDEVIGEAIMDRVRTRYEVNKGKRSGCIAGRIDELTKLYGIIKNETYEDLVRENYEFYEIDFSEDGTTYVIREVSLMAMK